MLVSMISFTFYSLNDNGYLKVVPIDSFLLCFTRTVPYYGRKSTRTVPLKLFKKIVRYGYD